MRTTKKGKRSTQKSYSQTTRNTAKFVKFDRKTVNLWQPEYLRRAV